MPATFSVLGSLAIAIDGTDVVVAGHRRRAVIARLALDPGIPVTPERLADDLWSDEPDKRSVATLRTYIAKLRNLLPGGSELLRSTPAGYALAASRDSLDALRFERLLEEASAEPVDAERILTEALALWRGGALEEFADLDWARIEASRLEELRLLAEERLVAAKLTRGGHEEVIARLGALTAAHPHRERFHVQLITALYRSGRQAEALEAQRRARATLLDDLGLDPGEELAALERRILMQDRTLGPPAWTIAATPPARPPSKLPPALRPRRGEPVFVGRERELAAIELALEHAHDAGARLVVLAGEPGIGKTRLAAEAAAVAAAQGATVLHGRCDDGLGAPYQPFVEALKEFAARAPLDTLAAQLGADAGTLAVLVPELAAHLPASTATSSGTDPAEQHRLFDAVASWWRDLSTDGPVLVVVDDVQWATRSTALLTQHAVRALHDRPVVLLATARAADLTPTHHLSLVLDALRRGRAADVVAVAGLDAAAVAQLVGAERLGTAWDAQQAEHLRDATGGNPFLITELARHGGPLADEIPAAVRDVLLPRVIRLASATQDVLNVASVVGQEFELDVVATVIDRAEDTVLAALDDGVGAGLLHEVDGATGRFGFAHAILHRAVYEARTATWRGQQHAAIASVLATRATARADDIAHHWEAAGPRYATNAAAAWASAGRDALARLAYDDAVRDLAAALRLEPDAPPAVRCQVLLDFSVAHARNGDAATARTSLHEAARLARAMGDPIALSHAALGTSAGGRGVSAWLPDDVRIELLEEAHGALPDEERELAVHVDSALALALYLREQRARRQALARGAVEIAEADGSPALIAAGLPASRVRYWRPSDVEQRVAYAKAVLQVADEGGDPWLAAAANDCIAGDCVELGDRAGFDRAVARTHALAAQLRGVLVPWQAAATDAEVAILAGDLTAAERLAGDALAIWGEDPAPDAVDTFGYQLGIIRMLQGRGHDVLALCDDALEARPTAVGLHAARAYALAMSGRLDEAAVLVTTCAADDLDLLPQDSGWLLSTVLLAEAIACTGQQDEAAIVRRALEPHATRLASMAGPHVCWGPVAHQLGALSLVLGDRDAAFEHLEQSESLARSFGAEPWRTRSTALLSTAN